MYFWISLREQLKSPVEKDLLQTKPKLNAQIVCISPHKNKKALSPFYHKKCF